MSSVKPSPLQRRTRIKLSSTHRCATLLEDKATYTKTQWARISHRPPTLASPCADPYQSTFLGLSDQVDFRFQEKRDRSDLQIDRSISVCNFQTTLHAHRSGSFSTDCCGLQRQCSLALWHNLRAAEAHHWLQHPHIHIIFPERQAETSWKWLTVCDV